MLGVLFVFLLLAAGCCPPWSDCDPECQVNPSSLNFGSVEVGVSKDLSFQIKNTAGGSLSGTVSLSGADYVLVSGGGSFDLGAGATHTVRVRFTPTSIGAKACKVSTGTGACPDVTCTGSGTPAPACIITPSSLSFDSLQVGSYRDLTFSIENDGGGELVGNVRESCAGFSVVSGGGAFSLGAGESRIVTVRYAPITAAAETCLVATGAGSCPTVRCTGVGKPGAVGLVTPDTLDFGPVQIGSRADLDFTIVNVGIGVLAGSVSESCGRFSIAEGAGAFALSAGDTHTVTIRFTPTTVAAETCAVDLGTWLCPPVVCLGRGEMGPECQVFPQVVNFGQVEVGSYGEEVFQIRNVGGGTLSGSVSEACAGFSIVSGGGDYSLEGGQTHTVTMRFAPGTTGQQSCAVDIGTGLCPAVTCVGLATPPPTCQVTPELLDFGDVTTDTFADLWVEIKNVGGGLLQGTLSENCYYFAISSGAGSFSLAAGEIHMVKIRFRPSTAGWQYSCNIYTGIQGCIIRCVGRGVDP